MDKFSEKDRRIYYQNIVYAICTMLDAELDTRLVAGTVEYPSTEVQDKVAEVLSGEPVGYKDFIATLKGNLSTEQGGPE